MMFVVCTPLRTLGPFLNLTEGKGTVETEMLEAKEKDCMND